MRHLPFLLLYFVQFSFAQITEYNYLGTLILPNNQTISFSMHFNEANGVVNGYSLTNIGNPDETKSDLSGIYFKKDRSFQLQETQILSTSSEADLSTFCFINANLTFKGRLYSKKLEGEFVGLFINNDTCAEGKILLMEQEKLEKKIKKIKKKVEKLEDDINQVLITRKLKGGDDFVVKWEADNLKLFVWDANREDGDRIGLKINDEVILQDYTTKRKRKEVRYKLEKGKNTIEFEALSLGSSPPNTSCIELVDSKIRYPIITQLEVGKTAIITIMK